MWGDNRISVELAHDARSGKNSTHFARRINYTQDMCKGDETTPPEYNPAHIPTEKNTVDSTSRQARQRNKVSDERRLQHGNGNGGAADGEKQAARRSGVQIDGRGLSAEPVYPNDPKDIPTRPTHGHRSERSFG